jgi:hypothetical protein
VGSADEGGAKREAPATEGDKKKTRLRVDRDEKTGIEFEALLKTKRATAQIAKAAENKPLGVDGKSKNLS